MIVSIYNPGSDDESMEAHLDPSGRITNCYCYVPVLDSWTDLTERVLANDFLVEQIMEAYDKRINEMLMDMAERNGNEY